MSNLLTIPLISKDGAKSSISLPIPPIVPNPPKYVEALDIFGSVLVFWDHFDFNNSYHVYRNNTLIGNTNFNFYRDSNLKLNKKYTYKVSAYNANGNSSNSNPVSVQIRWGY